MLLPLLNSHSGRPRRPYDVCESKAFLEGYGKTLNIDGMEPTRNANLTYCEVDIHVPKFEETFGPKPNISIGYFTKFCQKSPYID